MEIDHCEFYAWAFAGVEIRGYGGQWQTVVSNTGYTLDDIVFGDPDGDGVKDAIRKKGRSWFVYNRMTKAWDFLNGEFNGDLPSLISIAIPKGI